MKGFILAAGLGTRLSSLNLNVPKVMVPIGGKPLLEHHLKLFCAQGIRDIGINLHFMPQTIQDYFSDGNRFGVQITYSYEPNLLGTAGALRKMKNWVGGESVIVFYGDNLTRIQFAPLLELHREKKSKITLALYESCEPWTGGVVETDESGRVISLVEKPEKDFCRSNTISSGIFILDPLVLDLIPDHTFSDFGRDIFPEVIRKGIPFYAVKSNVYIQDIGTPERYQKAQEDFSQWRE